MGVGWAPKATWNRHIAIQFGNYLRRCSGTRPKVVMADNLGMRNGVEQDSGHFYTEFKEILKKQNAEFYSFIAHASKWHQPVDSGHIGNQLKKGILSLIRVL